jgi:hypothetical protein
MSSAPVEMLHMPKLPSMESALRTRSAWRVRCQRVASILYPPRAQSVPLDVLCFLLTIGTCTAALSFLVDITITQLDDLRSLVLDAALVAFNGTADAMPTGCMVLRSFESLRGC